MAFLENLNFKVEFFEFVPTAKLRKPGNFYNDICLVKIGVIKIGLRIYIKEREPSAKP